MSNSLITCFGGELVGDNTTIYRSLGFPAGSITEALTEDPIRDAGVFSNMFMYVSANTITVNTVVTFRKSVADTSITFTYASTETGIKEDTSNTSTFANTDEGVYAIAAANDVSGANNITVTMAAIQFAPTTATDCITKFGVAGPIWSFSTASTTVYHVPVAPAAAGDTATEANTKYRARFSFTCADFHTYVSANARTTNTIFGTRKNGGAGAQSVTYTSGQTGAKEDTANSDSLVAGDDFNYYLTTSTGTEAITIRNITASCITTSNIFPFIAGKGAGESVNFNVTTYVGVAGSLDTVTTTQANSQVYPRFDFTAKELGVYVSANTIATSASTVTLQDNGSNSAVTVSFAAGETGLKNDSSNTVAVTSTTDEVNYVIATPNTSGALTFTWIGILGDTSTETPSSLIQAIMF